MGKECDHNWIPYRLYGNKVKSENPYIDFHFKVTKVKCIKCDEVKEVD